MKKIISILLIGVMIFSMVGCGKQQNLSKGEDDLGNKNNGKDIVELENENNDNSADDNKDVENEDITDPKSKEVDLYFTNMKYIETGNESLEQLISEKRTVEYGEVSLEEAIVRELIKGTKNPDLVSSIPTTAKLLGTEIKDNTVYVNFSSEGMNGGSLEETLTINQILKSLLELDNVEKVQFLIDGNKADTLMGHVTISEPFESTFK
ncbi:GerMN domain-containing protein [Wansuia hejianensis]|uniref:GerMN domain-containing protein n=1 Tax=Wansuia hejianensis TaxID=2763667 RepID=A0A926F1H5_9FIRM|nr:GerMN domain-containing protein [Wansuia hejianensis]MBC8591332.1 GerMN domain-containing protein [Wansuia hejianensis]